MAVLDNQAAYERVRAWFSEEGHEIARVKRDGMTECVYRGDGDPHSPVRCAFGVLIPDELYDSRMEGRNCRAVLDDAAFPELRKQFREADHEFLRQMQIAHDVEAEDPADLIFLLDKLAREFGLTVVT